MSGLYSINLGVMHNSPNLTLLNTRTIFTDFRNLMPGVDKEIVKIIIIAVIAIAVVVLLSLFFKSHFGLCIRATGDNQDMLSASSVNVNITKIAALGLGNACIALSGGLTAQYQSFADVNSSVGMLVVGLASVIIGEAIFGRRSVTIGFISAIVGSIIYRAIIAVTTRYNIFPSYMFKLEVKNAVKVFAAGTPNEFKALNGLNLKLEDGEFVTIIGSNGAGKSTLFNAICGNFWLDKGHIILDGEDISYKSEHKRARRIGRIFQDPMKGTAPHLTIEENLALAYSRSKRGGLAPAITKSERVMFREALADFDMGLEDRMNTKVGLLSGGQRQVVTLLMATLVPPRLLLLDEHTAALDPATAEKVMEITKRIVERENLTTLMITHNVKSALETGDRTIMLDAGNIIFDIGKEERIGMTVEDLMKKYSNKKHEEFDNDRAIFS